MALPQVVPLFCLTFVDVGRGDGPIEYVTIGGFGNLFSTYALGADLAVESATLYSGAAKRFRVRQSQALHSRQAPLKVLPTLPCAGHDEPWHAKSSDDAPNATERNADRRVLPSSFQEHGEFQLRLWHTLQ